MSKVKRSSAVSQIKSAVGAGDDIVGAITFWSIAEVDVAFTELAKLFDKVGLDKEHYMPQPQRGTATFRKAIAEAKRGSSNKGAKHRRMIRPIKETDKLLIYGVVNESVLDATDDLDYATAAKICFKKDTETVVVKGKSDLADQVSDLYNHLVDYATSSDIQRVLRRKLHHQGDAVCLRPTGGVYFAAAHMLDVVNKYQQVVDQLGTGEMTVITVTKTKANKQNLGRNVTKALTDELKELQEQIEKFKVKSPREGTLESRLEQFKLLKKKGSMFSQMLGVKVTDLNQGIKDCNDVLVQLLGGVQTAKAEKQEGKRKPAEKELTRKMKKTA